MSKKKSIAGDDSDDRLMTLADLAHYLHLGQKTVLGLVEAGKLPGMLIDNQWRFRRRRVDEWLDQQVADYAGFEDVPDGMEVPLSDLLPDSAVIADLRGRDGLAVIEELAACAYSNNWLNDKPWFIGAVVEREALASTAMDGGVAFLHTRARDTGKVARPFIIVGRSYPGVVFGAPDGKPTYLFFLLGLKQDRLHLPILGRLARIMRNPAAIAKLRAMPSADKIRGLLLREDARARSADPRAAPVVGMNVTLDRKQRLRDIMRRDAIRQHRAGGGDEAGAAKANHAGAATPGKPTRAAAATKTAGKKPRRRAAANHTGATNGVAKKSAAKIAEKPRAGRTTGAKTGKKGQSKGNLRD